MQVTTLSFENMHNHGELFANMLRARHQTFIVQNRWDLPEANGMEFDQYDTPASRWVTVHDNGHVMAGVRLTPTTHRYEPGRPVGPPRAGGQPCLGIEPRLCQPRGAGKAALSRADAVDFGNGALGPRHGRDRADRHHPGKLAAPGAPGGARLYSGGPGAGVRRRKQCLRVDQHGNEDALIGPAVPQWLFPDRDQT